MNQILPLFSKNIDKFIDLFAGTTSVGRYFKKLNYKIYSSDLMYFSYVLQKAYIENNSELRFSKLIEKLDLKNHKLFSNSLEVVVDFLNNLELKEGFIYENYTPSGSSLLEKPRMYFKDENGKKIDTIRQQIENWKIEKIINKNQYFVLLACLIESVPFYANISGVYATFQKILDKRAMKNLILKPIEFISNKHKNELYNQNSVELINSIKADILYLDPPYNQRQYAQNYHILETIAKYDYPEIKGIGGLRNYDNQKSKFCNSKTALEELCFIAKNGNYSYLVLSYNSEGIMNKQDILNTLNQFGNVELVEFDYLRFKSNNKVKKENKCIKEQIYILKK